MSCHEAVTLKVACFMLHASCFMLHAAPRPDEVQYAGLMTKFDERDGAGNLGQWAGACACACACVRVLVPASEWHRCGGV